jgi:enoyl-CoA hydratase
VLEEARPGTRNAHAGRLISQGMVRRMFFTGEPIVAADLALRIAAKSPLGLRVGKQSLNAIEGLPVKEG